MKRKPDFIMVLVAAFGLGLVLTLLMPMSASQSVAKPVSASQAGIFSQVESRRD